MTAKLEIVPATHEHTRMLVMREDDRLEMEAAGLGPKKALWRSLQRSLIAKTAFVDGEIAAMWGCGGSISTGIGNPWLMTTEVVERFPVMLIKNVRREVAEMLGAFRKLKGIVPVRYSRACRLLEATGFSLGNPFPFGPYGALFQEYEKTR